MKKTTVPLSRSTLLDKANELLLAHEDYLHGMKVTDVEQKGATLVFRGDFFLDNNGLPTAKTTAVFNMFKHLSLVLSAKYHLQM